MDEDSTRTRPISNTTVNTQVNHFIACLLLRMEMIISKKDTETNRIRSQDFLHTIQEAGEEAKFSIYKKM